MRKTKKVLSVILACITIFGTSVTAFAADKSVDTNENIEIVNLSQNIDKSEIEEIKDSVVSNIVYEDGTEVPMATVVTIEDAAVSSNARSYSSSNNSYKVTVTGTADTTQDTSSASNNSRKIVSDSADRNNKKVVASISLQMIWTDVPGDVNNILNKVSVSRTVTSGTVSKATVSYWDQWDPANEVSKNITKKTSYSCSPNMCAIDPSASYGVHFEESIVQLYVSVSASIFQ